MPSKSQKQHNFMEAVAHNPDFAARAGVSQKVGREFVDADKGMKKPLPTRLAKKTKAK